MHDHFKSHNTYGQRMELVDRGGETYIMPIEQDTKITNVRKWEQAFRVYADIYSQANPTAPLKSGSTYLLLILLPLCTLGKMLQTMIIHLDSLWQSIQ